MTRRPDRPDLHVCIATGQNLANLIPALQLHAREVVVLETPAMRESARNLERALAGRGISVIRVPFDDATPEAIVGSADAIALDYGERPLILNATGGHKLITLALAEKMTVADDLHVLYAETRHDRLDWLKPHAVMEPMTDVLRLDDLLLVQGYRIVRRGERDGHWMQALHERANLTRRLGDEAQRFAGLFGVLNGMANDALGNGDERSFRPQQAFEYPPRDSRLLREAERLHLLHWDGGDQVVFSGEGAARYFRGGWLEEYVILKLRGIAPADWASDIEIEALSSGTRNQFDALVVHRNRLLVVECKTARFGRDAQRDADYVYKLAQLARSTGGIMAAGLLLSARPVSEEVRNRARTNAVSILAAAEVRSFVDFVRSWMRPA